MEKMKRQQQQQQPETRPNCKSSHVDDDDDDARIREPRVRTLKPNRSLIAALEEKVA
jgi:hypothetical protein